MLKIRRSPLPYLFTFLLVGSLAAPAPGKAAEDPRKTPPAATAQSSQDEPLEVGGEVKKPVKISGGAPLCATRAQGTGIIQVDGVLDKQGKLTQLKVVKPLNPKFDACVLKALGTWKFKPATKNGEPVRVKYTFTLNRQTG